MDGSAINGCKILMEWIGIQHTSPNSFLCQKSQTWNWNPRLLQTNEHPSKQEQEANRQNVRTKLQDLPCVCWVAFVFQSRYLFWSNWLLSTLVRCPRRTCCHVILGGGYAWLQGLLMKCDPTVQPLIWGQSLSHRHRFHLFDNPPHHFSTSSSSNNTLVRKIPTVQSSKLTVFSPFY